MTTQRFFVPPESIQANRVSLAGSVTHQMRNVLRMTPGERVVLLDDSGWEYEVELEALGKDEVTGRVLHKTLAKGEPRTKITLYQGILKGHHFEFVLQKCTEIGVVEFVPVISDRCLVSSLDDISANKTARWQRIILEAAEQSRRGRLPRLQPPMLFPQACDHTRRSGLVLMPWEEEEQTPLRRLLAQGDEPGAGGENARRPFSISLMIGPEGGFTEEEADLARRYHIHTVTLGSRILRAETAALVAAALVLYEMGDLA